MGNTERLIVRDGKVILNGAELNKVRSISIKNIDPTDSPAEVTLCFDVDEVNVDYSRFRGTELTP